MKSRPLSADQQTVHARGAAAARRAAQRKRYGAAPESHSVRALLARKRRAQFDREAHRQVSDYLHRGHGGVTAVSNEDQDPMGLQTR